MKGFNVPTMKVRQNCDRTLDVGNVSDKILQDSAVRPATALDNLFRETPALPLRLASGQYDVDMVKIFRGIIVEVDADQSGEIDREEFLETIQKLHEHEIDIDVLRTGKEDQSFTDALKMREANAEQLNRMVHSMFASLDGDASGSVSVEEMAKVLFPRAYKEDMDDIVTYLLMPPTPRNSEDDEKNMKKELSEEAIEELRMLFNLYDKDRSGSLTVDELRESMQGSFLFDSVPDPGSINKQAASMTTTDFERLVMASDMDGDGMIDFDEWCSMMSFMYLSESDDE
eukprot:g5394.t1